MHLCLGSCRQLNSEVRTNRDTKPAQEWHSRLVVPAPCHPSSCASGLLQGQQCLQGCDSTPLRSLGVTHRHTRQQARLPGTFQSGGSSSTGEHWQASQQGFYFECRRLAAVQSLIAPCSLQLACQAAWHIQRRMSNIYMLLMLYGGTQIAAVHVFLCVCRHMMVHW